MIKAEMMGGKKAGCSIALGTMSDMPADLQKAQYALELYSIYSAFFERFGEEGALEIIHDANELLLERVLKPDT